MRVLIDEDTAVQLVDVLDHVLPAHEVRHAEQLHWKGKQDRSVLADAGRAGFHVIVTRDRAQLHDPYECEAIKKSGLHHVRYRQRREGLAGLALALGAIIAAMPPIMAALEEADGQRLVQIAGLDPNRRFDLTDPRKKPPSVYWPH